jgi:endonuclease G
LYLQADIQRFIDGEPLPNTFPPVERMQHGTTVCSIAAGRRTGNDTERHFAGGVAPEASLIVIRYDLRDATIGYNTGHVEALFFIDRLAKKFGKPVVVNISNGMNTGAHDGTSVVETACETFLDHGAAPGRVIVKSAGNERLSERHAVLGVSEGAIGKLPWLSAPVPGADPSEEVRDEILELWFDGANRYRFRVNPPKGLASPWFDDQLDRGQTRERLENMNFIDVSLDRLHKSGNGWFQLKIAPGDASGVQAGEWLLEVEGINVLTEKPIHAWVERMVNRKVRFLDHVEKKVTITIPGTSGNVIVVGAVGTADKMQLDDSSSYGPTRGGPVPEKPDLVAPGVRIRAALAGKRVESDPVLPPGAKGNSGTSFAAPHVTGAIALLLSAAEKKPGQSQFNARQIRQALLQSARHFKGRWNEGTGYGELDVDKLFATLGL